MPMHALYKGNAAICSINKYQCSIYRHFTQLRAI